MLKKFLSLLFLSFALVFWVSSCNDSNQGGAEPKDRLKQYITKSFAVNGLGDRKELEGFLTGEAKSRLNSWSDEQFLKAFVDTKRKFHKLLFKESSNADSDTINITYEISYMDESKGTQTIVTNKKLCTVKKVSGQWLISEVKNLKEMIEYQNEMSLP